MQFTGTDQKKENGSVVDSSKPELKILKLGSDVGATKNMTVYECGDDIIIVDCGVEFPDSELLGVDVVIPDTTYLIERKEKVRGMFITHGHEDHLGAIPFIIGELNVPIYANKLVQGFVKDRLRDKGPKDSAENTSFHLMTPETEEIELGNFKISAFGVNHSVPDSMGFAIKTPQGTILHMADYKIDWSPVLDKPIELGKIADHGEQGVLCLISDCLGSAHEGYTVSERTLDDTFPALFERGEGRQVFVTLISSAVSRMYQVIDAAVSKGKKVVFAGRSVRQHSQIARDLGYLPFDDDVFVDERQAKNFKQDTLIYIIAGCYGQPGSGLGRLSRMENKNIELQENALVVFSADPNPPGVQENFEKVLHNLTVNGAEVLYSDIQDNLHVGGHGMRGDLMTVSALSQAKYYIPVGGTAANMRTYRGLVGELGVPKENVFELLEGDSVFFNGDKIRLGERLELEQIYISGRNQDELSPVVMKDREQLSNDGVFFVIVPTTSKGNFLTEKAEIVTRGFIYVKDSRDLMNKSKKFVTKTLNKHMAKQKDWGLTKRRTEQDLGRFLYKETGRNPMVLVHSITI